ncbi:MAG: CDP-glucose 4,6-dehydratase [Smithella sp.]|jgi:CDP-glucose 4,6-dehydratase
MKFWKNRKVFITGHTGFKGSWLSFWLNYLGADVTGYALEAPTNPNMFEICGIGKDMNSIIADIRDLSRLKTALKKAKPEIVIHMAAQPLVRESYRYPLETYSINFMGTVNLLEAVRSIDCVRAFINVTTDKVYENEERQKGYAEDEPLGGYDPYSSSKACSEIVTQAYRRSYFNPAKYKSHNVAVATVRAGNVIGGGDWGGDRLVPDFVRAILAKKEIKIRNPRAVRPWQHVLEPLAGYILLAEKLYKHGPGFASAWNFGPERKEAKPVEYIVKALCKKWEGSSYSIDAGVHPHEAGYLYLNINKAKKLLGWKPKWPLDTVLDKVVEWTREYKNGADMKKVSLSQIKEYMKAK